MALEAVVFQQDFLGYNGKDIYNNFLVGGGGGNWSYDSFAIEHQPKEEEEKQVYFDDFLENQTENNFLLQPTSNSMPVYFDNNDNQNTTDSSTFCGRDEDLLHVDDDNINHNNTSSTTTTTTSTRPKRRRSKSRKNKEEIENQRMTHIAVERNRRKQMNEYLSVLRSLMPDSYVQRGDQASIIGGAINFVKELEHSVQLLGAQQETKENPSSSKLFAEFFTFPQYSTASSSSSSSSTSSISDNINSVAPMITTSATSGSIITNNQTQTQTQAQAQTQKQTQTHSGVVAVADIEVTMVESHANLKIRSKRRPKQLLKMVSGLHSMRLTILHLNVTTVDPFVLYSLSVKIEDDCKLTSVDDIATAVYQLLGRIQEDALC